MSIQKSGEDYLEAILVLKQQKGVVRSIDVAHHMEFSKPSVSRAVGNLRKDGLLEVRDGGELVLTPAGQDIAEDIHERHNILKDLFVSLGVGEETAAHDACLVEHVISPETFDRIKELYYSRRNAPAGDEKDEKKKKKKKKK